MYYLRLLLFVCLPASCCGQQMHFALLLFGDSVGYMHLERTHPNDSTEHYSLRTRLHARVLFIDRLVESGYEVTYVNGRLTECRSWENSNGQRKHRAEVMLKGGTYIATTDRGDFTFTETPRWSIAKIFMQQPADGDRVFYEGCAGFSTIRKIGAATFQYKSCDGHTNNYTYRNGSVHSVEFDVGLVTLRMRRCY